MSTPTAAPRQRVALQGFSGFERNALAACFRLAGPRHAGYDLVDHPGEADLLVADADEPGLIERLQSAGRAGDTLFIGGAAAPGALGWLLRPIDPLQLLRTLDAAVAARAGAGPVPAPVPQTTGPAAVDSDAPGLPAVAAPRAEVLIVDDSEIALCYLERELLALGLPCHRAQDSSQALARLDSQRYGLLLLDVELGEDSELDGLQLCQQVKQRCRREGRVAPVVLMLSAHEAAVDRVRGTFAGCDGYLGKPLDGPALRRTLVSLGMLAG